MRSGGRLARVHVEGRRTRPGKPPSAITRFVRHVVAAFFLPAAGGWDLEFNHSDPLRPSWNSKAPLRRGAFLISRREGNVDAALGLSRWRGCPDATSAPLRRGFLMAQPGISGVGRAGHDFTGSAPFFSINRARFRSVILALASASLPRGKSPTRAVIANAGNLLDQVLAGRSSRSQPWGHHIAPAARAESRRGILWRRARQPGCRAPIPRPENLGDTSRVPWRKLAKYQKPRRGCRRGLGWQCRGGSLPKLAMGQRGIGGDVLSTSRLTI